MAEDDFFNINLSPRSPSGSFQFFNDASMKRARGGSISGRLRTASDLEEIGVIDRSQKGVLKDLIISGDSILQSAFEKYEKGDPTELESIITSGILSTRRQSIDLIDGLDLDFLNVVNPKTGQYHNIDDLDFALEGLDDANFRLRGLSDISMTGMSDLAYISPRNHSSSFFGELPPQIPSHHTQHEVMSQAAFFNATAAPRDSEYSHHLQSSKLPYDEALEKRYPIKSEYDTTAKPMSTTNYKPLSANNVKLQQPPNYQNKLQQQAYSANRTGISENPNKTSSSLSSLLKDKASAPPATLPSSISGSLPSGPGFVGAYPPEMRKERVARFIEKRKRRVWTKKVKYDVRKNFADSRVRVKGRFVKKEDEDFLRDLMGM